MPTKWPRCSDRKVQVELKVASHVIVLHAPISPMPSKVPLQPLRFRPTALLSPLPFVVSISFMGLIHLLSPIARNRRKDPRSQIVDEVFETDDQEQRERIHALSERHS